MRTIQLWFLLVLLSCGSARADSLGFVGETIQGEPAEVSVGRMSVVCFLGTECPMAKAYAARLSQISRRYADRGLQVVGVMSNVQDSREDISAYVSQQAVEFPIVHDIDGAIADRYAATRTPEVYLLDEHLLLRYHGRIDDQYAPGVARAQSTRNDLEIAIEQLLSGKPVSVRETRALGCVIGRAKRSNRPAALDDTSVTFTKHVSRVIAEHCLECHRQGDIGPFAMESYDEVVGWADTMLEVVDDARMPPWHASPKYGQFSNARHMPAEDKQILRDWIAGGKLQGDPADAASPIEFTDGWQLPRKPDAIYPMRNRPFVVPRDGVVEYQYFVVDPGFTEDRWIAAAQIIAGSRSVVHHAIVFVRPPDDGEFRGVGGMTAYVPGQRLLPLPSGHARKVPAGSKFVFQMHYTPNGSEQEDLSQLGLIFADPEEVTHEVYTIAAIEQEFEIPPEVSGYDVTAAVSDLPHQAKLLAATPHMHFRGAAFRLLADRRPAKDAGIADDAVAATLTSSSGVGSETLLHVPNYDFNWQHTYHFSEPLNLQEVSRLHFEATFDNSPKNPFNPDSQQWVTWGDQTWEEMAVAFFEVAEPLTAQVPKQTKTRRSPGPQQARDIQNYVARVMQTLDADGDGKIKETEASIVIRRSGFWRWDRNRDGVATLEEVQQTAERLFR